MMTLNRQSAQSCAYKLEQIKGKYQGVFELALVHFLLIIFGFSFFLRQGRKKRFCALQFCQTQKYQ